MNILNRILIFAFLLLSGTIWAQNSGTYLDTLNSGKELIVSFPKKVEPVSATDSKSSQESETKSVEPVKENKEVKTKRAVIPNGFRIQIIASSSVDAIREKKEELEEVILLPLYISFKSPYYKLVAGNFIDRASADKALIRIKEQGITDAWVVSSEVFKKE